MAENSRPSIESDRPRGRFERLKSPALLGVALLAALLGWQWFETRTEMTALREEVARRLRDADADSREARGIARETAESLREAQARIAQLELKLAESQNQQVALEALYQELARNRDDWIVAEVEQILAIAQQQLQLAGNVPAALAALQIADARLARTGRSQFMPLRRALAHDIERLKSAPNLDVAGLAVRLDQIIAAVDSLPLAQEARPRPAAVQAPPGTASLWARLGAEFLEGFRQLVRVERIDDTVPELVSPSQAFFLRENLKLRLLSARLALLSRDEAVYRGDLQAVRRLLQRYFDTQARPVAAALGTLAQASATDLSVALPTIGESLAAVRAYKSRERP